MAQVNAPQGGRRDLTPFEEMPQTALGSYMKRAVVESGNFQKISAFLPSALWNWVSNYLVSRIGRRHKFLSYKGLTGENGVYRLGDQSVIGSTPDPAGEVRVGLVGDWGTGTDEANAVAERLMRLDPHYTIHIGDVYYVGDKPEVEENCLGKQLNNEFTPCYWPVGSVGSFAMNGNHEMYALGNAYFDLFLPKLGMRPSLGAPPSQQKASYFCLQNDFWQIIALDTGYNSVGIPIIERIFSPDCHLRQENIDWLQNVVSPKGKSQGLIILSHHQYFSAFEKMYPTPAEQIRNLIDRPVLWFWGHEHRMAVYGQGSTPNGIQAFGRCIGHGGMPVEIDKAPQDKTLFPPLAYDRRPYQPPGEHITVGYNGFAMLTLKSQQLRVDYYDWRTGQGPLLTEQWEVQNGQLHGISITRGDDNLDSKLTVPGDLNHAIGK
jgi:hypothetical protein